MKTIKRIFLLVFSAMFFTTTQTLNAQVTIGGETAPVTGATLDLSPSGGYIGGLKLPNVALTSLTEIPTSFTDKASITATNLKGLQVYNTTTNASIGLAEGVYTWNGSRWTQADMNQNLVYSYTWAQMAIAITTETEIASFTLAPGLYLWSLSMPIEFTNSIVREKYCSFYLRDKATGTALAELRNNSTVGRYLYVNGVYPISIDATTNISFTIFLSESGGMYASNNSSHRLMRIIKIN